MSLIGLYSDNTGVYYDNYFKHVIIKPILSLLIIMPQFIIAGLDGLLCML